MFEAANGYEIARVSAPSGVSQMAVSPDGDYLVTVSEKAVSDTPAAGQDRGTVRVIDLKSGRAIGPLLATRDRYIAVSERARVIAAADDSSVEVIEVATRRTRTLPVASDVVTAIDISPDGQFVAIGDGKTLQMVSTSNGKPLWTTPPFDGTVAAVAFSYDGQYVAVGTKEPTIRVFIAKTGQPLATVAGGIHHEFVGSRCKPPSQPCQVSSVVFSRDNKHLATSSDDRTARVFDLDTGRQEATFAHVGPVVYAVFTRDDARYVATASNDFTGRLFEVATGKEMWHLPLRDGDFFPIQFAEHDKYVLRASSIGDEVVVERHPWRVHDMLDDACSIVSRDLAAEEWRPYSEVPLQACPESVSHRDQRRASVADPAKR